MLPPHRFNFKTKQDLLKISADLNLDISVSDDVHILFESVKIGNKRTVNRFVVQPMEGCDANFNGAPGELTFRRYQRYAAGGSGLIWFEATAVTSAGRSNAFQLMITKENLNIFKNLVQTTRGTSWREFGTDRDLLLILQLTHAGRFAMPEGKAKPFITQHNPLLDSGQKIPADFPLCTDEQLDILQEKYIGAAILAQQAGFDGVDIKACHGYLISELLASFNRMDSKYGGAFDNRIRFLFETVQKIKENLPDLIVTSRLSVYDGIDYPYGFGVEKNNSASPNLSEPARLIQRLADIGLPILNISIGNPYYSAHISRPYSVPLIGKNMPEEHPLVGVNRLLNIVGELQLKFPNMPMVGSGYSWLRNFFPNVAADLVRAGKVCLVGFGRSAFAYPDAVNDLAKKGKMDDRKVCVACSRCTQIMKGGGHSGCAIRDKKIYGSEYTKIRRKEIQRIKKIAGE